MSKKKKTFYQYVTKYNNFFIIVMFAMNFRHLNDRKTLKQYFSHLNYEIKKKKTNEQKTRST